MDILLRDAFRRSLVQAILAVVFALICAPTIALLVLLTIKALNWLQGWLADFAANLITFLAYPIEQAPAQLSALLVSTFPAFVTAVCFDIDRSSGLPKQSEFLNLFGKIVVVWLVIGAAATLILMLVFATQTDLVGGLVDAQTVAAMKLVVTGLLSFQFIYIVNLLGLENAVLPKK